MQEPEGLLGWNVVKLLWGSELGGHLPARSSSAPKLPAPPLSTFAKTLEGSGDREQCTTMTFVALLLQLLKDKAIGPRVVPIVTDEARTLSTANRASKSWAPV